MTREIEQRTRNVWCLELLDASYRAHARGLHRARRRLAARAVEIAPDTYSAVIGGMLIGQIPDPMADPLGWAEYLDANHTGLARARAAGEPPPSGGADTPPEGLDRTNPSRRHGHL